jgi:hypothetical protein
MFVAGTIRGKSYRTQLSVAPLHCVSEVPVVPEKYHFFSFAEYLIACNGERGADSHPEKFECEETAGDQNYERSRVRQDAQQDRSAIRKT